jgi:hypothetical protein
MSNGFNGADTTSTPAQRPAPRSSTVKVIIKDHSEGGLLGPYTQVCADKPDDVKGGRKGCGATLYFYFTHPNRRPMPFDMPPVVVEQWPVGPDALVVAEVESLYVHFSTCPHGTENDRRRREWMKTQKKGAR